MNGIIRAGALARNERSSTLALRLCGNVFSLVFEPGTPAAGESAQKHIGFPKAVPRYYVIQCFDTQTGAERAAFDQAGESRLLGFSPDGGTLWTSAFVADSVDGKNGVAIIRGWVAPSPWPPAWLFGVTAGTIFYVVMDWRRSRRHVAGALP